ncbi:MAG: hypothetical protein WCM76_15955 [Bacteroidota bacterium]
MKIKIISIISVSLFLVSTAQVSAKVWRVNNNVGVNANFSTMTAAMSGAAAGDTLYVEGSPTSYGAVTLSKKLVILGAGYFLSGAGNDTTQANPNPSTFGLLTISTGASGSVISGITVTATSTGNLVTVSTNNITLSRCYFYYTTSLLSTSYSGTTVLISSGVTDVVISQCFIYQGRATSSTCGSNSYYTRALDLEGSNSNIIVSNNIIKLYTKTAVTTCGTFYAILMATSSSAIFNNNVIIGSFVAYNSVVANNIQIIGGINGDYITSSSYPNVTQNNIGHSTQFGTTNGNKSSVSMSTVFMYTNSEDADNHYRLKSGSPALAAGQNGVDCGAFGGAMPYVLSGLPAIPTVFNATVPTTGTTSTGINVNTKAKARK